MNWRVTDYITIPPPDRNSTPHTMAIPLTSIESSINLLHGYIEDADARGNTISANNLRITLELMYEEQAKILQGMYGIAG